MKSRLKSFGVAVAIASVAATCVAANSEGAGAKPQAKDIFLDRISSPVPTTVVAPAHANTAQPVVAVQTSDAMSVSVLLESPSGTLTPKSTDTLFKTGDRFRVKLLASRDGKVSLFNTNPRGELTAKPIWTGNLKVGQETISPRLVLGGNSGVDYLHVVLEPKNEPSIFEWVKRWIGGKPDSRAPASKDISLDVQNTPTNTYLINNSGSGLVTTVRVVHTAR